MNKSFVALLLFSSSSLVAEPRILAPVIDNSTYKNGSIGHPEKPAGDAMNEVLNRLEQMQQEMQELRGSMEEQAQSIDKVNKRQNNIYTDLDQRVEQLSEEDTGQQPVAADVIEKPIAPVNNVVAPKVPASPVAVTQESPTVTGVPAVQEVAKAKPVVPAAEPSKDNSTTELTASKDQKELYQHAYEMLRNGHNIQAIEGFNKLLTLYPKGKFASNSQYWLGEAYKVTNNLEAAKIAFSKVVESYGKSYKVPDALLKLGYIELEQGNHAKAKQLLTRISRRYPNTTVAHLANKKLLQLETVSP